MAVRAAGHGLKPFIVFFMKGKMYVHGEMLALDAFPGIEYRSFGQDGWVKKSNPAIEHRQQALLGLAAAREAMLSGLYKLVVMDEINGAMEHGLLTEDEVIETVTARPEGVGLILTGRNASPRLMEMADTVTEMRCVKHAFDSGMAACRGIDY
jgi:cob(I)alamin adenosyltransferase